MTFLFTDVQGSTRLLHELGSQAYAEALARHRRLIREACTRHGGVEVDTQGDAFFFAFPTAPGALGAAEEAQRALAAGPISVRMGLHTGTPHLAQEGYVGADVHRAARIAAAGHGGQVLLSSATAAIVGTDGLRDLGDHRLKDLSAPERIHQLGDAHFPPLKSLYQTNLPVPTTPFLGRDEELRELADMLRTEDVRLLTLTGPGGTGKTRLGLQAAGAAADAFPDGVWWVSLAAIRDPGLVLDTAARSLGAQGDPAEHIGDKRMLILFDNFEQVTDAATDAATLVERCPRLTVLVTSREPLRVRAEREYAVDPLQESEAVALFRARALAVRRDFSANGEVRRICARLDNLPLALELAAARVKVLSPTALLERLEQRLPVLAAGARDVPERQRTLQATIEWSYDLLSPVEQRLFARLSVFRGGFTLEAAEHVADADLDVLQSLVDKSLARVRDTRFWMLETIGAFAADRLQASGEVDDLRRRHADFFLDFAEEAESVIGPEHQDAEEWVPRLEADHENLRAALDHLADAHDGQRAQQLAGALWKFWYMRGYVNEGRRRLEAAVAFDTPRIADRARALNGATAMALESGDNASARRYAEEAFAIRAELGDPFEIAHAQFLLANVAADETDWPAARMLLEQSRAAFQELNARYYTMLSGRMLAWILMELGQRDAAIALHHENLALARATGNKRIEAMTLGALAHDAIDDSRYEEATSMVRDSYRMRREEGDRMSIASILFTIARLLVATGRPDAGGRVLARSLALYEETGAAFPSYDIPDRDTMIARIREDLDEAEYAAALAEGGNLTDDEVEGMLGTMA